MERKWLKAKVKLQLLEIESGSRCKWVTNYFERLDKISQCWEYIPEKRKNVRICELALVILWGRHGWARDEREGRVTKDRRRGELEKKGQKRTEYWSQCKNIWPTENQGRYRSDTLWLDKFKQRSNFSWVEEETGQVRNTQSINIIVRLSVVAPRKFELSTAYSRGKAVEICSIILDGMRFYMSIGLRTALYCWGTINYWFWWLSST